MKTDELKRIFDFTDEDLAYNRRGEESPRQRIKRNRARLGGVVWLALLGLMAWLATALPRDLSAWTAIVVALAALIGFFVLRAMLVRYPGDILRTSGPARLGYRAVPRGADVHFLQIYNSLAQIPPEASRWLVDGAAYTIYAQMRPKFTLKIVSIEPAEDPRQ